MTVILVTIGRVVAFLIFVALGLAIRRAASWTVRRRLILTLAAYTMLMHGVSAATQKDAWPFANNNGMHGIADPDAELYRISFFGVDESGREWRVDPYAWRSISDWHLQLWFYATFERTAAPDKERLLRHLYALAERHRAETAKLGRLPHGSILGPLRARDWWMFDREDSVPAQPYRELRVYAETWTLNRKRANQPAQRRLMGAWRA